jgi:hypothetical protein
MKIFYSLVVIFLFQSASAQLTCDSLRAEKRHYDCFDIKNGKGRLYRADTAITNRMQHKTFDLIKVNELNSDQKELMKKYKVEGLNGEDHVIFYDWDILNNGAISYSGLIIGEVRINCKDSVMTINKYYLSRKPDQDYVPSHFKIHRLHEEDFIFYNKDQPYLNINYFFKKAGSLVEKKTY